MSRYDPIIGSDDDGATKEFTFHHDGAMWQVSAKDGSLEEVRQIDVTVTPEAETTDIFGVDINQDEWPTALGQRFHAELLEMLDADVVTVDCEKCDEYPILAIDQDEATAFAENHQRHTGHDPTVSS